MLPEKFCIHTSEREVNRADWFKYIAWINEKNNRFWHGMDNNDYYNSNGYISLIHEKEYKQITLKEFFEMKEEKEFIPEIGKEYLFYMKEYNDKYQEIYVGKTKSGFYVSHEIEDEEKFSSWDSIEKIPEELELTLEQIAEKFNVSVENLKIKK